MAGTDSIARRVAEQERVAVFCHCARVPDGLRSSRRRPPLAGARREHEHGHEVTASRPRPLAGVRRGWLVIGGAVVFFAGATAAGVVTAVAAPAAPAVINGCVNTTTRVLTVPASGTCPAGTTALQWNSQGPAGPQGPAGVSGLGSVYSGSKYHLNSPRAILNDGTDIWVASTQNNSVVEIKASDGAFVRVLSGGSYNFGAPVSLAYDGAHIWVGNQSSNSVTEVSASDGSFVGTCPAALQLQRADRAGLRRSHIWAANFFGNTVTEVNAERRLARADPVGRQLQLQRAGRARLRRPARLGRQRQGNSVTEMALDGTFERNLSGAPSPSTLRMRSRSPASRPSPGSATCGSPTRTPATARSPRSAPAEPRTAASCATCRRPVRIRRSRRPGQRRQPHLGRQPPRLGHRGEFRRKLGPVGERQLVRAGRAARHRVHGRPCVGGQRDRQLQVSELPPPPKVWQTWTWLQRLDHRPDQHRADRIRLLGMTT